MDPTEEQSAALGASFGALSESNPTQRGTAERDLNTPDPILAEAERRFKYVLETESSARQAFLEDYKFAEGDSDNGYQWPNQLRANRDMDQKPTLTINETRQRNLQIINDSKQNKPGVKIRPTGNGATREAANVYQDVVRHIEYHSNAQAAYDKASEFQVKGGFGFWRVVTDYANDDTFEQDIFIRPIEDPLGVFLDPDAKEPDKSDANYGFIFRDLDKETFKTIYPEYAEEAGQQPLSTDNWNWVTRDSIRVAEYLRRVKVLDALIYYEIESENGPQPQTVRASTLDTETLKTLLADPTTKSREVWDIQVEWYLIVGRKTREKRKWPGKYIPIVMVIGEETIIDGVLDRKGHTRAMKDPQRMYNYWASSAVEHVALQTKVPWITPAEAVEEYQQYWNTANTQNHSFLPYKSVDDNGNPIAAPTRPAPPEMPMAYVTGMQIAQQELARVSGQFEAAMGQASNERTGRAIDARQRKADNSTYHYVDNLAMAIRHTGKILLDLIPRVYDTQRIMSITAEDGEDYEIQIDPEAKKAFEQKKNWQGEVIQRIFNPRVGHYELQADVGPNYATKQEEAWNAYSTILTQNPELVGTIGDLLFRAGQFPYAEEAAARLKRMVPAQAKGEGPSQETQQLQAQVQNLENALAAVLNELSVKQGELKDKDRLRDTNVYDSETKRLGVIIKMLGDIAKAQGAKSPDGKPAGTKDLLKPVIDQLVQQMMETKLEPTANGPEPTPAMPSMDAPGGAPAAPGQHHMRAPPVEGARMAPDGHWYVSDPERQGKYLKVLQNAGAPQGRLPAPAPAGGTNPLAGLA